MLPDFFLTYTEYFQPLNLFKYITFRSIGALLTALLISFIFGPKIIALLKKMQKSLVYSHQCHMIELRLIIFREEN